MVQGKPGHSSQSQRGKINLTRLLSRSVAVCRQGVAPGSVAVVGSSAAGPAAAGGLRVALAACAGVTAGAVAVVGAVSCGHGWC